MGKIWGIMVYLSHNMWQKKDTKLDFEDEAWEQILKESAKAKLNTILLDVGDGVQFGSHPELEIEGAWTRQRVRAEVKKAKAMGLDIVPKLNFSTTHDFWLGEYARMISTKYYYNVCRDLIREVYELFDHPKYIHLGLDEENLDVMKGMELAVCRGGELIWHDVRFLLDCVRETGATPWIWSDYLFDHPEKFREKIGTEDILLSPWFYDALREEHYTLISSRQAAIDYYSQPRFRHLNMTYVEEDPFAVKFREQALPAAKDGFHFVPCSSTWSKCKYNTPELVEYFHDGALDENIMGFMTAPWVRTKMENMDNFRESIRLLVEARKEFYPEEA